MKGCIVVLANGQEFDFFGGRYIIDRSYKKEVEIWQDSVLVAIWRLDAIAGVYYYGEI